MTSTLAQIRDGLKAALATYYEANGQPVQVYDTVPGDIVTPCVIVEPASGEFHTVYGGGSVTHTLSVHAVASIQERDSGQNTVDAMISPTGALSIVAAIAGDRQLGGTVSYAEPGGYRDYGTRLYGTVNYLFATVDVVTTVLP